MIEYYRDQIRLRFLGESDIAIFAWNGHLKLLYSARRAVYIYKETLF